jgi:ornithine cyclodeaminase
VQGRWLKAGAHLDLIGSFTPAMRECDDDALSGAALYVDTAEALTKCGDLIGPLARGVISAQDVRADLATLCRQGGAWADARADGPGRRTVFKSVGSALEDLAAALLVLDLAGADSTSRHGGGADVSRG